MTTCSALIMTPLTAGAVAIVQLHGDVEPVLESLTRVSGWPLGRLRHVMIGGIDDGVCVRLTETAAQVMPHGGVRVIQCLANELAAMGIPLQAASEIDPRQRYPEASCDAEARMLSVLARAASPLAIDLLLAQPERWNSGPTLDAHDRARSARLNRLIDPPWVVLAGPPNVGKSTLSNALHGRAVSITQDQPGTTRDYTTGRIDLAGLVVDWHDTPGLRATDDAIETDAMNLARRLMDRADLLIAMTDDQGNWPALPREPDLKVAGKCDRGTRDDADVAVSGTTGAGLEDLVHAVRERLVPTTDLEHPGAWLFDDGLV